jgi:hypothetical protein
LEITVRNEVPARIFSMGTFFLIVISRGTYASLFYFTHFYWEPFFQEVILKNMIPLGSYENNC